MESRLINTVITESAVRAVAPGKIILSGEHAVVYGNPALAMAVSQFCEVTVSAAFTPQSGVLFEFVDFGFQRLFTLDELNILRDNYKRAASHNEIIIQRDSLAIYAFVIFAEKLSLFLDLGICDGMQVKIKSFLPFGSGMGSSAALIIALGKALLVYITQKQKSIENIKDNQELEAVFLVWAKQIEDLQHGKSSGIDLHLAYYGGMVYFKEDKFEPYDFFSPLLSSFRLVNTGKPINTTRECVEHVKRYLAGNSKLLADFAAVTYALDTALRNRKVDRSYNFQEVSRCILENHKLLCGLKVVPDKVNSYIAELAKIGMTGKISGAGTVEGDNAGIVLVYCGDDHASVSRLGALSVKYNYQILSIGEEQHGVRII